MYILNLGVKGLWPPCHFLWLVSPSLTGQPLNHLSCSGYIIFLWHNLVKSTQVKHIPRIFHEKDFIKQQMHLNVICPLYFPPQATHENENNETTQSGMRSTTPSCYKCWKHEFGSLGVLPYCIQHTFYITIQLYIYTSHTVQIYLVNRYHLTWSNTLGCFLCFCWFLMI